MLWLHDSLAIWRSVHFLGHASTLAIIFLGSAFPPRKPSRDRHPEKVAAKAAVQVGAAAAMAGDGAVAAVAAAGAAAAGTGTAVPAAGIAAEDKKDQ